MFLLALNNDASDERMWAIGIFIGFNEGRIEHIEVPLNSGHVNQIPGEATSLWKLDHVCLHTWLIEYNIPKDIKQEDDKSIFSSISLFESSTSDIVNLFILALSRIVFYEKFARHISLGNGIGVG